MAETRFIRTTKQRDYTVLDNHFLRDDTLSAQAKGVMAYLLFLPEDWTIYQSELCKHFTNGKDSIRSIIKELEEHGYISKSKAVGEKGRFAGYDYTINECPCLDNRDGKSAADNPPLLNTNKPNTNKPTSSNSVGPDFPTEESEQKKSFKREEYTRAYNAYKSAAHSVGKSEPYFNIRQINSLLKFWFTEIGVDKTIECISKSVNYDFVRNTGFEFSTILSSGCFTRLINNTYGNASSTKNVSVVDQQYRNGGGSSNSYAINEGEF